MGRDKDETSGFFNKLTFGWMNKTVKKVWTVHSGSLCSWLLEMDLHSCSSQARKGDIDINELTLPVELESERAYAEFQQNWDDACKAGKPKLQRVLWKTFGKVTTAAARIAVPRVPDHLKLPRTDHSNVLLVLITYLPCLASCRRCTTSEQRRCTAPDGLLTFVRPLCRPGGRELGVARALQLYCMLRHTYRDIF